MGNVLTFGVWALVCLILVISSGGLVVADGGNPDLKWKAFFPSAPIPTNVDLTLKAQNISTISVCSSGCNYTHIQDAINASKDFDIIRVDGGIYPESLTISKAVSIHGVNGTVLVGDPEQDYAIVSTSDLVDLADLSVVSAKKSAISIDGNFTALVNLNITAHDPDNPISPVITGNAAQGTVLLNCTLASSGASGVALTNTSLVLVRGCRIALANNTGYMRTGIDLTQNNSGYEQNYLYVENNQIQGGGISVGPVNKVGERIVYPPMNEVEIRNNTILNSNSWGIHAGGFENFDEQQYLKNFTVRGNQITGTHGSDGALIVKSVSGGSVTNNLIDNFTINGDGIELNTLQGFTIGNNTVRGGVVNGKAGWAGMAVIHVTNSTIRNNSLSSVSPYGFIYAPGPYMKPNIVFDSSNTADGHPVLYYERADGALINTSSPAMVVLMSCSNMSINNTTISGSGLGIGVYQGENISVTSNRITDSNTGLMLVSSDSVGVSSNSISGGRIGMGVGGNSKTTIKNNLVSGFEDTGVVVHGASPGSVQISNNTVTGALSGTDQGFAIMEADGATVMISNNTVSDTICGMFLSEAIGFQIRNNLISNSSIGLNLNGAQNNVFSGNVINNSYQYSEGVYLVNSLRNGGGISKNNLFANNYIRSANPINLTYAYTGYRGLDLTRSQWGTVLPRSIRNESGDQYPNIWNTTKIAGINIVNGSFIGGNYYATLNGTGWSETHADRGDGFVAEPNVFDANNTDYLPLHMPGMPTPTPTATPTVTPTWTPIPQPIVANFTATPRTGTPPLTVQFTDLSSGSPAGWNWTFGDGSVSHEQNPVHVYSGIGRYTVTLEVRNSQGQDIERIPSYVVTTSGRITGPNGMIWISSAPLGADVYVDRVKAGVTPLQSLGLPAGIHQVRVSVAGYHDWVGYVQINSGTFTYIPKVILQKS
ncbi:MAG TPA: right-handed parallel beta-helix repeat-containing protein [Methanospirillum sp.]|uniref:right-handed parallel beta-helix repeat-containing protein n=1 Tax=Methanospirillum sp. TaxID=45200 RepID=UPI002C4840DA|nr:right-handed parallel beta-helix repeat-containing protein [Methanospirillum sp.]HWQ64115.1 right-handed parallel beta-helix repeat-containing protein [Methanospirillum sp.]